MSEVAEPALVLPPGPLPRHVAIIMDGNGRWAQARGLPRLEGHREGARSVREVVRAARRIGLEALTLYAFSEQNWDRPADEVTALMELLHQYVHEERQEIMENGIRLVAIGETDRLPAFVYGPLRALIDDSAKNTDMVLCLALSYGAREDLTRAARALALEVAAGRLDPAAVDEQALSTRLATAGLPPLDLLIRTSGEQRISNFLLWEAAYAELLFVPTLWPEFRKAQLVEAILSFQQRERRFGLTSEQLAARPTR
ncbi:MAG: di-trans,poly-cis-decaprenylcistransferase [Deltaproteobacteria bacterium]|nr:di-trans,poly-cis-decaprenylcistransferase [Deltaproteobacteria bacterium]